VAQRITAIFEDARRHRRRALMPYVCAGYPTLETPAAVLPALERAGASVVEIGIPFSDPIADGPVIAAAMHKALEGGATPLEVFDQVASVRSQVSLGLVAMCSVSIVHRMGGSDEFCGKAAAAGFDGLIVPDVPLEESAGIRQAAARAGLTCSLLIAPTTPPDRAKAIAAASTGFIYVLARTGLTGERAEAPEVGGMISLLRASTSLPIAVGFGISRADHVRAVVKHADAAIVGSALVRRMGQAAEGGSDPVAAAEAFTRELAVGLAG
jgi:tryptophan synthase alpha chain